MSKNYERELILERLRFLHEEEKKLYEILERANALREKEKEGKKK